MGGAAERQSRRRLGGAVLAPAGRRGGRAPGGSPGGRGAPQGVAPHGVGPHGVGPHGPKCWPTRCWSTRPHGVLVHTVLVHMVHTMLALRDSCTTCARHGRALRSESTSGHASVCPRGNHPPAARQQRNLPRCTLRWRSHAPVPSDHRLNPADVTVAARDGPAAARRLRRPHPLDVRVPAPVRNPPTRAAAGVQSALRSIPMLRTLDGTEWNGWFLPRRMPPYVVVERGILVEPSGSSSLFMLRTP